MPIPKQIKTFCSIIALTPVLAAPMLASAYDLTPKGTYHSGAGFDEGGAEIVAFNKNTGHLYVVNSDAGLVDVLNISNINNPVSVGFTISAAAGNGGINSVATHGNIVAAAVENADGLQNGTVEFFNATNGQRLKTVSVGVLPDMVKFTPDGKYLVVANEGEPHPCDDIDPEGSISIIDVSHGVNKAKVRTADFHKFDRKISKLRRKGVRISELGLSEKTTVSQDLEPEYVAISSDSRYAYVTLQENNAIAIVDIKKAKVKKIVSLGTKDHSLEGNALDASNKDGMINITNWPVEGLFMPDSIDNYKVGGKNYYVIANEGDSREYLRDDESECYVDETRVAKMTLDPQVFPDAATLQLEENLGRLKVLTDSPTNENGEVTTLYSMGARSFSILDEKGRMIFDSGEDFARITAALYPNDFNTPDDENAFDDRSDDKGVEAEGVAIGKINGETFAFIGLERVGGVMMYNVSNPLAPEFVTYANNRDFNGDPEAGTAGDLSPEGIAFISAAESPSDKPLVVLANEVSGTTTIYEID